MRIGILHPDPVEAGRLSVALARLGHKPVAMMSGPAMADAILHDHFDALLMRWDGDDLCGVAVMHRCRAHLPVAPAVLMLMTPGAPGGIAETADRLINEPASDADLQAAIDGITSLDPASPGQNDAATGMVFDAVNHIVTVRGHPVQLTAKEFALARMLIDHAGEALSRDRIMGVVWGRADLPGSRTLDAHIAQVRKRLALRPEHGWRLSSVYGFGYRLDRTA